MDAVEFVKTLGRMCNCECYKCEIWKRLSGLESCTVWIETHPEEAVAISKQWAKEHPIKTRQSEFLKQWPDARIHNVDGLPSLNPCHLDNKMTYKCNGISCQECREKFWLAEVEGNG